MSWNTDGQSLRTVHLTQGEVKVSDESGVVMTTLVGSCVSACIFDPVARVGGMNHFLLPDDPNAGEQTALYGINQMELLINRLLGIGARKSRLQAKLFGGNCLTKGLSDIGAKNAQLAEGFLISEAIPCIGNALRGTKAQRIQFQPATGKARVKRIADSADAIAKRPAPAPIPAQTGEVELF
ncbi:chemotaxis protein CheD [uncultured Algimonas sp.]|uniref:chemotaxis protein CheD n=1 Tax=uncultured Algimonas sp. TaxID=1547920 RepID=UPI0026140528|nr:chemotaxis protein CheD [uncultured Algimonas sp.]